ncbi:MAG: leucine-rich repeat domain-containing protein [Paludibacteraceae bacterium]|nr:leucine-rich repeat domain-containing protein [Paludibacteraceae bacterium]MBQ6723273.1 leucine-rich repeat domain-containing protein [Paludibacteraceae bacterium]
MEKKNLFCLLFVAFLLLKGTCAYATVYNGVCGEHLTWTYDTGTGDMIIEGYGKLEKTVDSLWWKSPVVEFAQYSNNYKATSPKRVILPEGVTSICSGAFSNFALMTECNIPDGVTKIGSSAFSGCSKLKHMFLPNSVDTIGASAFNECKALDSLDCGKGVKYIGEQAFFNCDNLDYLRWSDSLEYLGRLAFDGMSEQGGRYYHAFPDTLFFPATLRSNEQLSWASMNRLKAIVWNVRKLDTQSTTGYGHILYNPYTSYKEIIFGPDVEEIPDYFMVNQKAITRILLPEGTRKIGNSAFSGCAKIEEIVLPSTLETIDPLAFQGCLAIKRADIPSSISSLSSGIFKGCTALERVTLPEGMTAIGDNSFAGCAQLDSIVLPQNLCMIGSGAFKGIVLPDSLFIPDKVVAVGGNAFEDWSSLEYLSIGKNVTLIGDNAFKGDSAIKKITVWAAVPPMVSEGTLADIPDSAWLSVLPDSRKLYREHAYWGRFRMADVPDSAMIQRTVTVDAAETTADFTWPTDSAAHSYQIDIYKDNAVFCKLTLGNRGQLLGIAFSAPGRRMAQQKNADDSQPYTLSFKVTGLDAASRYNYVLSTLDANGTPLHVYIGDFATLGYQGELQGDGLEVIPTPPIIPSNPEAQTTTAIEEIYPSSLQGGEEGSLILINGQLLIRRDDKTYTLTGQIVQ